MARRDVEHRAPAERHDEVAAGREELVRGLALDHPEAVLSLLPEDHPEGRAGTLLDDPIEIERRKAEPPSHEVGDRRLAGPHGA